MTCNHYYFNAILENYGIENMILENNSKIEKHLALCQIQDIKFNILLKYIVLESIITTISMSLKNANNKNLLTVTFKQSQIHTR